MITINIILGCLMLLTIGVGTCWTFINYSRYKKNTIIANELDLLLKSALDTIKKNQKFTTKQEKISISDLYNSESTEVQDLNSPVMLSTMLTVLVRKYGDVRLSMRDFMIPDEEYVSVYVDVSTKELILSINHALLSDDSYAMVNFTDSDDNTFH